MNALGPKVYWGAVSKVYRDSQDVFARGSRSSGAALEHDHTFIEDSSIKR